MANKEKRAKRAKVKAKANRVAKRNKTVECDPMFDLDEQGYITSKLVGDLVPEFDGRIVDYIKVFDKDGLSTGSMRVAVLNKDSVIYREITAFGMKTFLNLVFFLQKLGLRDIFEHENENNTGFDAAFILPDQDFIRTLGSLPGQDSLECFNQIDLVTPEKYNEIFNDYMQLSEKEMDSFLDNLINTHGMGFDPEELLELLVGNLKSQLENNVELLEIALSPLHKWHEIAIAFKNSGFNDEYTCMIPLIKACGYDMTSAKIK